MQRLQSVSTLLFVFLLVGCGAYHPLKEGVGFTDAPMGDNAYKVTYRGESDMPVAEARQFALILAAELAALHGTPYFKIVSEKIYVVVGTLAKPGNASAIGHPYYSSASKAGGQGSANIQQSAPSRKSVYVEDYASPEVRLRIQTMKEHAGDAIPSGTILLKAQKDKVELSPGVAALVPTLPAGDATIPPAPEAMKVHAAGLPDDDV